MPEIPMTPEELKTYLGLPATIDQINMTGGEIGALIGHLERICGGADRRRLFLAYIYGSDTSRTLHIGQWLRLKVWLAPKPEEDEAGTPVWTVRRECYDEARAAVIEQQKANIQAEIERGQQTFWSGSL